MARKKGKKGGQPSKYGSPYQPRASGSSRSAWPGQAASVPRAQRKSRSPALWLIGACALAAGVAAIGSCSDDGADEAVTVRRASYASQADCEADWNAPEDCESVPVDDIYASSLADPAGSNAGSGSGSGGGHGGGYHGGYYGGTVARWYGPYYTQSGTVYHPDGTQTRRDMSGGAARPMGVYDSNGSLSRIAEAPGTPHATMVEEATLRRSSLGRGVAGGISMRSAAVSRAPVSSRGGFTSRFGGSGRSGGG